MGELFDINNLIVVKHNRVIDAEYSMSIYEQRILLTCIAKIDSTKELAPDSVFVVTVDDIIDLSDVDRRSAYANLKHACESLFANVVTIDAPNTFEAKKIKTRWVCGLGYVEEKGKVELSFTPQIIPFLTQISRDFTKYNLSHVLKFKSAYSYRLYELLCRWGNTEHTFTVEWLREKFQLLDKYERMVDFKNNVIDVAVGEINATSNIKVTYEQIKKGRNIAAFRFVYTIKHDKKFPKGESEPLAISKLTAQPEKPETTGGIVIDISQFNDKDKQLAQNALAKVPEATQRIILDMFKSALAKGEIKYPLRYLNSLVSKSLSGDLDTTAFENKSAPSNHFERRAEKIKQAFAKHTDEIKAKLATEGHIIIKGEGTVSKSEFEALGLIEKAPRTGSKTISLSELIDEADIQENLRKEQALAQKKAEREKEAQHSKNVADIPVVAMSEKEIAARQKILELEAQLIAADEFVGVNEMAISKEELAELAEFEAMQANLMKSVDKK